jgi:hypothetical protein
VKLNLVPKVSELFAILFITISAFGCVPVDVDIKPTTSFDEPLQANSSIPGDRAVYVDFSEFDLRVEGVGGSGHCFESEAFGSQFAQLIKASIINTTTVPYTVFRPRFAIAVLSSEPSDFSIRNKYRSHFAMILKAGNIKSHEFYDEILKRFHDSEVVVSPH